MPRHFKRFVLLINEIVSSERTKMNLELLGNIRTILDLVSSKEKFHLLYIIIIMTFASLAEVISIGALIPLLELFSNSNSQSNILNDYAHIFEAFNVQENNIKNFTVVIFCIFIALSALFRVYQVRLITKFSFSIGLTISYKIYENILSQNYAYHIANNSSEIISSITMKVNAIVRGLIYPILNIISGIILIMAILFALLKISPLLSSITLVCVGVAYLAIYLFFKSTLKKCSVVLSEQNTNLFRVLRVSLTNIREVILGSKQNHFLEIYYEIDKQFRSAQADSFIIQATPRFFIEAAAIIIILTLSISIPAKHDGGSIIIAMGAIVYGIQRLLPVMQLIYSSVAAIKTSNRTVIDTLKFLNKPLRQSRTMERFGQLFKEKIEFKNVSFAHQTSDRNSLSEISIEIPIGARVGITGQTGSGKSTFCDLVAGLLEPTKGCILVDGIEINSLDLEAWHSIVSYVPQDINLKDGTIAENIAFGEDPANIQLDRLKSAIDNSGSKEFIERLSGGIHSNVGENGINFSGGQRQRLAIARSLYQEFKILILDEATSALDKKTESIISDMIYSLGSDKTIFIIAHRIEILEQCDLIINFENGRISEVNSIS